MFALREIWNRDRPYCPAGGTQTPPRKWLHFPFATILHQSLPSKSSTPDPLISRGATGLIPWDRSSAYYHTPPRHRTAGLAAARRRVPPGLDRTRRGRQVESGRAHRPRPDLPPLSKHIDRWTAPVSAAKVVRIDHRATGTALQDSQTARPAGFSPQLSVQVAVTGMPALP